MKVKAAKINMIRSRFPKINQAVEWKAEGEKGGKDSNEIHKSLLY